ncbi:disease resistance protein Pik-2-like [Triticum dicoccoides]|uniref:disease resistance protein Pik-2-like n=1 Tax=Triticum dicoccoides TaxID=85692 RepID=UPI000E7A9FF3|nr:disease resistance protein Pik-2-like [Triticum dicoccoides]
MELVVGASGATMKSLLGKLGGLLAQEYTLIRGVNSDLQYINDELATMQSFLRTVAGSHGNDELMKDWMKQIRDVTYDVEDCIDDSGHRLHRIRADRCCYFLVSSVYEVLTWWPRRDVAARISVLKVRAQQIGERRQRYGVDNPQRAGSGSTATAGFDAAANQDASLQIVAMKEPVGVDKHMEGLERWITDENSGSVLYIVGFGGVGKTTIAKALYKNFGEQFSYRAMVTVSQSSDVEAVLRSIKSQVTPQTDHPEQPGSSAENRLAVAVKGVRRCIGQGKAAVMNRLRNAGSSVQTTDRTKQGRPKGELEDYLGENSYLFLIDDVWSAATWDQIRKSLPLQNKRGKIIVTTRFQAVAMTRRGEGNKVCQVEALKDDESKQLFKQALLESRGREDATTSKRESSDPRNDRVVKANDGNTSALLPTQAVSEPKGSKDDATRSKTEDGNPVSESQGTVHKEVWSMCGGLPLAIVTMAGHVACNPGKSKDEWLKLCSDLFPGPGKVEGKEVGKKRTQEEVGKIVSHCYDDMPAEIKTCSLYLSIFPKGHRISRKRLTRRWIAEGFVSEKQGLTVEDVAETYFNHLIRRKIILPVDHSSNGKVKYCIVHDMVLEHIVAKASEENFITVVGGNWLMPPPSGKVRRLSLQGTDSKRAKDIEKMNLSHVRSLTMFGSLNNQLSSHSFKFGIVQVLDLEGCMGFKQHHTMEICKMLLLKYLSLRGTDIKSLPDRIGKLVNLETLDIRETNVVELPKEVCQLEQLVNILGGNKRTRKALKLPGELNKKKKMKGLRILSGIEITAGSVDFHHLTELRKLAIYKLVTMGGDSSFKELRSSIEYLGGYSLHTLIIGDESSEFINSLDDLSSPPIFLIALELSGKMVKLPRWIRQLSALNKLNLPITALRTDNLRQLSDLEELFSLTFSFTAQKHDAETLTILSENKLHSHGQIKIPDSGYKSLKLLRFAAPLLPLLSFPKKAMPELEMLELRFNLLEGLFGIEYLAKLKDVHLTLDDKTRQAMTKKIVGDMENAAKKTKAKAPPRIILETVIHSN